MHTKVRKPEGKRPRRRRRCRYEDNIKMNSKELGSEGVNWIHLAKPYVPVMEGATGTYGTVNRVLKRRVQ
jgi:hypothetical protein